MHVLHTFYCIISVVIISLRPKNTLVNIIIFLTRTEVQTDRNHLPDGGAQSEVYRSLEKMLYVYRRCEHMEWAEFHDPWPTKCPPISNDITDPHLKQQISGDHQLKSHPLVMEKKATQFGSSSLKPYQQPYRALHYK